MMDIKEGLLLWFTDFWIKSPQAVVLIYHQSLMNKWLKNYTNQFLEILKKRTVYSGFRDSIWGADLAEIQLISKFNKGFRFLLCVIDIFSKYTWVVCLKDKRGISLVNAFQKILHDSNRKPNKIWVYKGSEFYNSSFKKLLKDNGIEMYSIRNKGNSIVAEKFVRN